MRRALLLPLLFAACTPAPAPTVPEPVQIPSASAAPVAPLPTVSVVSTVVPEKLAIDGDLGEWLALEGDRAGSRLAFALDGAGLHVAAELVGPAREGIWLGVGTRPPPLPPIGDGGRAGNVEDLDCENERGFESGSYVPTGKKLPPEEAAACKALIAEHEKLTARHVARFGRRLRVDREGARLVEPGGKLSAIAGAKIAWKAGEKGTTVELSLPLAALPRLAEAPLLSLAVWAAPASAALPEAPPEDAHKTLLGPVSFAPHAEVRAAVYEWIQKGMPGSYGFGDVHQPNLGFSYHPADPEHVETMHYASFSSVRPVEETLYEKREALGDLEIGYAHGFTDFLVVSRKGKLVSFAMADVGCWDGIDQPSCGFATPRGMVHRDGEVHVFASYPGAMANRNMGVGGEHAGGWFVVAVATDGTLRPLLAVPVGKQEEGGFLAGGTPAMWNDGAAHADKAMEKLTWRGTRWTDGKGAKTGVESLLKWDPVKKQYTLSWSRFPVPKDKPTKGAKRR
jgi:hypothetical protein